MALPVTPVGDGLKYKSLGNSGLKISPVILGCMGFGSKTVLGDWILDKDEDVFEILKAAYDAGIRTWDTSNSYSIGISEAMIGRFLKKYEIPRHTVVILSKCFFNYREREAALPNFKEISAKNANAYGLSRKYIMDAVDDSVARLGTYIDVLQIHRHDPTTPDEEVMRALNDVVTAGKVRYIGASSMYAYQFISLQNTAEKHGWNKFISMQNMYSALYREEEREMIPYCQKNGVGLIPYSPNAGGSLTRPKSKAFTTDRAQSVFKFFESFFQNGPNADIIDRVEEIAEKLGVPMAVVATAYVISKGFSPIIGITKKTRIDDAVAAAKLQLSDEDVKYIDELYKPVSVFGMIES